MKRFFVLLVALSLMSSRSLADSGPYKLLKSVTVGGDGRWDYITVDSDNRKLYIPRTSRTDVFDVDTLQKVGEIPDTNGVHGVAIDPASGHGFTSNRSDPSVTMFDLKTLAVIKKIPVTGKPDGIFFDPFTKHVFLESHSAPNETIINAADGAVLGTLDLGGEPEQGASDGKGHVYINLESTSEVVAVDPVAMKVTARYPLGDGEGPSGMGFDAANHRIFSFRGNQTAEVLDADSGKILATLPIGDEVDSGTFNPDTMEAFSSNGDGTLTVIHEKDPNTFEVEQNVETQRGARTCALDKKTGNILLVTAKFMAPTTQTTQTTQTSTGRHRPRMVPGSFTILVLGKG